MSAINVLKEKLVTLNKSVQNTIYDIEQSKGEQAAHEKQLERVKAEIVDIEKAIVVLEN